MEDDELKQMKQAAISLSDQVSDVLTRTFEAVAKTAMQEAALSADPNVPMIEKIRKAHSSLTLIVDDAMRGANKATDLALAHAIFRGALGNQDD